MTAPPVAIIAASAAFAGALAALYGWATARSTRSLVRWYVGLLRAHRAAWWRWPAAWRSLAGLLAGWAWVCLAARVRAVAGVTSQRNR